MADVAVVVPVYQANPKQKELNCFTHNCRILANHQIFLVAPHGLDVKAYQCNPGLKVEFFSPDFFNGLKGYNRFMLSEEFYRRFENFKYILICQLDVLVFRDDLKYWIDLNYDYVGAPWINRPITILQYVAVKTGIWNSIKLFFTRNTIKSVGNGGFSLRKTKSFIDSLSQYKTQAEKWTANEDFYWSFFAKKDGRFLSTPNFIEASKFCIEVQPRKLMKLMNHNLPMGIHAWERYDPEFWNKILKQHGYEF